MDVLLTGDLSTLTGEICRQLRERKVYLVCEGMVKSKSLPNAAVFSFSPADAMFEKLFASCSFGAAIYLGPRGERQLAKRRSLEELDCFLNLCAANAVPLVLYVTSGEACAGHDDPGEASPPAPVDNLGHVLAAGENLCRYYREQKGLNTVVLHVPYLYGASVDDCLLARLVRQAGSAQVLPLPGGRRQLCDFVRDTDLALLIAKLVDEGYQRPEGVMNVGSGKPVSFEELAYILRQRFGTPRFAFAQDAVVAPPFGDFLTARKYYDWVAASAFFEEMDEITGLYANQAPARKTLWSKIGTLLKRGSIILHIVELGIGFLLMQYLCGVTETVVQFRYVDFRLLYVVVFGSLYGKRMGFAAAACACASGLLAYGAAGLDWKMLLYNIDNWFPFIAYLSAGFIVGYMKEKSADALTFERERRETLEQRYVVLYELYDKALQNKSQYKDQIMSYRDSFGRIYAITKKLDHVLPEEIFRQAIAALEDVLESRSVAIYSVDANGLYARLAVTSEGLDDQIDNSIELRHFFADIGPLQPDTVWCNKTLLAGYPSYCAPIYDGGKLSVLVMVYDARFEQLTTYYENLITILCGLIQSSLSRAANYNAAVEERLYLAGTRIVRSERFHEILLSRQKTKEENRGGYMLLRIETRIYDLYALSEMLARSMRATDIVGHTEQGNLYLLLAQAKMDGAERVRKRLEQAGLRLSVVTKPESVLREFENAEQRQAAQT